MQADSEYMRWTLNTDCPENVKSITYLVYANKTTIDSAVYIRIRVMSSKK